MEIKVWLSGSPVLRRRRGHGHVCSSFVRPRETEYQDFIGRPKQTLVLALQLISLAPSSHQRRRPPPAFQLQAWNSPRSPPPSPQLPPAESSGSAHPPPDRGPGPIGNRCRPPPDPPTLRRPGAGSRRHPRVDATPWETGIRGCAYLAGAQRRRGHRAAATAATAAEAAWPGRPGTAGVATPLRPEPRRPWRAQRSAAPASSQPGRRAAPPRPRPAPALREGLSPAFPGTTVRAAQHPAAVAPAAPSRADLQAWPGTAGTILLERPGDTPAPTPPQLLPPVIQNLRSCPFTLSSLFSLLVQQYRLSFGLF